MRTFLLLAAASFHLAAHAQLTNGCFTIGGTQSDGARAGVQTSDGGYAFTGFTYSYTGSLFENAYVVKVDADGAVEWNMVYGNTSSISTDFMSDMIQTADGGFALAGVSTSQSMALVKLDAAGVVLWSKQYDTYVDAIDDLHAVVQTPDGGYALAGSGNNDALGGGEMLLLKTDAAGELEWSKTYSIDFFTHEAYDVVLTLDGGYALGGDRGGSTNRFHVLRLDASGAVLWSKGYGDGQEYATAMVATSDNGFVVVGRTNTYGLAYNDGGAVYHDAFAVKLDEDGELAWARAFGDSLTENFLSVAGTSDGGYVMCGEALESGQLGVGPPRIYVVKCDANGELLWSQRGSYSQAQDVVECTDGGLALFCNGALADFSNGSQFLFMKMEADGTICPDCLFEPYGSDSAAVLTPVDLTYNVFDNVATSADYIVDVFPGGTASGGCLETGITDRDRMENAITITPNPAMDQCSVSLGNATDIDALEVISSQGTVIMSVPVNRRSRIDMPVSRLAQGVYVIRAIGSARPQQVRLVVMDR